MDASNIDGDNNSSLSDGDAVSEWLNLADNLTLNKSGSEDIIYDRSGIKFSGSNIFTSNLSLEKGNYLLAVVFKTEDSKG